MFELFTDKPKSLGDDLIRQYRIGLLSEPHIKPLTVFVEKIRIDKGQDYCIPYIDPLDGGVTSKVLFVLLAPGPKAVKSGFISRNNPDSSAKNMFEFLADSGLKRDETILWNIVPWYIGNESRNKIRYPVQADIVEGLPYLESLISLLPNLEAIVLVGEKAWKVENLLKKSKKIRIFKSNHPSPQFVNRKPRNKSRILEVFRQIRMYIDEPVHTYSDKETSTKIPPEVYDWVTNIFRNCNINLSEKLSNNPNCHEEHLDIALIEFLSKYASPITIGNHWTVRIDTHFIGGRRHFYKWEVADIGVLVFFKNNGELLRSKTALLQSKRLYPLRGVVKEETKEDMMIGISSLLQGATVGIPLSTRHSYEFDRQSKYKALTKGDSQFKVIDEWSSTNSIPIYYLLYNPWKLPFSQSIPLIQYKTPDGECELGTRIIPSTDLFRALTYTSSGNSPCIGDLEKVLPGPHTWNTNIYGWRLEKFFKDLLMCNHGYNFDSVTDLNIERLFYRKNVMLVAAIAISIELN